MNSEKKVWNTKRMISKEINKHMGDFKQRLAE